MKIIKLDEKKEKAFTYYTNGERTIKVKPNQEPPEGFYPGQHYKHDVWNKGLTKETDERVKAYGEKGSQSRKGRDVWNKGLTAETDERVAKNFEHFKQGMFNKYGYENPSQRPDYKPWNTGLTKETSDGVRKISDSNKGKPTWNKGLTKETDERVKGYPHTEETKKHLSDVHSTDEMKLRKYNSLKANGNLGLNSDTKPELEYYKYLLTKYDSDDIIHPYSDERYPYKCDFYIKSEDLFIEIHGNWTHGGHPFDPNNPDDIAKLNSWKEKAEEKPYYKNAIYTWTNLDPRKVETAKKNNIKLKVIYK